MKYALLALALISPLANAEVFDSMHQKCLDWASTQLLDIENSQILDYTLKQQIEFGTDAAIEMGRLLAVIQCKNQQQQEMIKALITIKGV